MNYPVRTPWRISAGTALTLLLLSACADSGRDDLRSWMVEQRNQIKPAAAPLSEPKKFRPEAYTEGAAFEPFNIQKLTQALRRDTNQSVNSELITPELSRRKEALESLPLDTMAMVGSLNRSGKPVALVQAGKLLYQVRMGNYLGLNYGRITRITETELTVREVVQDASGEWIERLATLQLQEKQDKPK